MAQTTSSVDTMVQVGTAMIKLSSDMIIVDDSSAASDIIHGSIRVLEIGQRT